MLSFIIFGPLAAIVVLGLIWGVMTLQQQRRDSRLDTALYYGEQAPRYRASATSDWLTASSATSPQMGTELKTDSAARTVLRVEKSTTLRLYKKTDVRIDSVTRRGDLLEIDFRLLTGRLWIDAAPSERIQVTTDAGTVLLEGRAAEITLDADATRIISWRGRTRYIASTGDRPTFIEEGHLLALPLGAKPSFKTIPHEHDLWQSWNLHADPTQLAAGILPPMARPAPAPTVAVAAATDVPRRPPAVIAVEPPPQPVYNRGAREAVRPRVDARGGAQRPAQPPAGADNPMPAPALPSEAGERAVNNDGRRSQPPRPSYEFPVSLSHKGLPDVSRMINSAAYHPEPVMHSGVRAQEVYRQVSAELASHFAMTCVKPIAFQMVNTADLTSEGGHDLGNRLGLCKSNNAGHKIFALEGTDGDEFLATVAHECSHAWVFEHAPLEIMQSKMLNEGFATWMEYKYFVLHGCPERARVFLDSNSDLARPLPYIDGLHKMLEIERAYGEYGVFHFMTTGRPE